MAEVSLHLQRLDELVNVTAARFVEQATADGVPVAGLPAMKLRWYEIRKGETARGAPDPETGRAVRTQASVYIYDSIGGSFGTNAKQFAADLAEVDADVIQLRLNTPGGSVKDALAIMNTLRAHPAYVHSHVDGIVASAGTIVMMAGDTITVEPGGEVMVHKASTTMDGDDEDFEKVGMWLRRQSENVADLYAQKSGGTREQWMALMTEETWMYGPEAVAFRLADRAETLEPIGDPELAERMHKRHSLRGYRHEGRAAQGDPKPGAIDRVSRKPAEPELAVASRAGTGRRRVASSEIRDAAQLRQRALDRRMMTRSAPAGIATMARRSPAGTSGEVRHGLVKYRDRDMIETSGFFTIYGRPYEMWDLYGPYEEEVVAGSGLDSIMSGPDTVFLMNHTGISMARTGGAWNGHRGTLTLKEEPSGGWHQAYLNPERPDVQLMVTGMDDGQLTEMSYAFMIDVGEWNDDMTRFRIHRWDIDRGDVSNVNFGANPYTSISARAAEILDELEQMPGGAIREAVNRLSRRVDSYEKLLRDVDPGALARIAEPALAERGGREGTADEKAAAEEWVSKALGRPVPPAASDDTKTEIIDSAPPEGPTVASYEALLQSMGVKIPQ